MLRGLEEIIEYQRPTASVSLNWRDNPTHAEHRKGMRGGSTRKQGKRAVRIGLQKKKKK